MWHVVNGLKGDDLVQRENWKPYRLNHFGVMLQTRSVSKPSKKTTRALYGGAYPLFETGDIKSADLYLSNPMKTYNEKGLAQSKLWNPGLYGLHHDCCQYRGNCHT